MRTRGKSYHSRLARRVISVAPMPPEKSAYALARYSRSADSIRQSLEWVKTHNSGQFLESFYFQYGHQSIADLGHTVLCFEGISELAASKAGRASATSSAAAISPGALSERAANDDARGNEALRRDLGAAPSDIHFVNLADLVAVGGPSLPT